MSGLGKKVDGSAAPKGEKVSSGDLEPKAASLKPQHSAKKGKAKKPSVTLHSFFGKAGPAAKKAGGTKPNASMGKAAKSAVTLAAESKARKAPTKGGPAKVKGRAKGGAAKSGKEEVSYAQVRKTDVVLYGKAKKGYGSTEQLALLDAGAAAVNAVNGKTDKAKRDRLDLIKEAIDACRKAGHPDMRFLAKGSTAKTLTVLHDEKAIVDAVRMHFKQKKDHAKTALKHAKAREIGQPKDTDIILAPPANGCAKVDPLQDALKRKSSDYQELDDNKEKRALLKSILASLTAKDQKIFVRDKHDAAGDPVFVQPGEDELIAICQKRLGMMKFNLKGLADKDAKQGPRTYTAEEDALIVAFVHKHRDRSVVPFDLLELPGRETKSVRKHFNTVLKHCIGPDGKLASLSYVDFAPAEDASIVAYALKAESRNEAYRWPVLAESMPGRTPGQLHRRYVQWLKRCVDEDGEFHPGRLKDLPSLYSVIRESPDHCQKYLASFDIIELKPEDEGRMIPAAGYGRCHEHQLKPRGQNGGYANGGYNLNGAHVTGPDLHIAACVAKNGPASVAELEGKYTKLDEEDLSPVEASHICQNSFCCNPDHLKWESQLYNLSRNGCSGYILIMLKCGKFLMVKNKECKHSDRCKNFFSNSPMSVDEVKSLFG